MELRLFVGNLDFSTSEEVLAGLFKQSNNVASVQLITDRDSGNPKAFGFVEMPNNSEADQAIKSLNRSNFKGRTIKVNQAQKAKNKAVIRRPIVNGAHFCNVTQWLWQDLPK